jgi:hypothetical protein
MLLIPTIATPNQQLDTQLSGQNCTLRIYQKRTGLFMDVLVDGALVIGGVLCLNQNLIVRNLYLGFTGDFTFVDTLGKTDPVYTGLGEQYLLLYLETTDLAQIVGPETDE